MRKHIIATIQAHAAAEYPRECCGLLLAIGRAQKYFPCRNIAKEPNEEFRLDPEDYAAAEDLGEVIGIVHSHPDATSRPSFHQSRVGAAERSIRSGGPSPPTPVPERKAVDPAVESTS